MSFLKDPLNRVAKGLGSAVKNVLPKDTMENIEKCITSSVHKAVHKIIQWENIQNFLRSVIEGVVQPVSDELPRIFAISSCLLLGVILVLLAALALFLNEGGMNGKGGKNGSGGVGLAAFVVFYTLGVIVLVAGFGFFVDLFESNGTVFAKTRIEAAVVAIVMIVLIVISAVFVSHWFIRAGLCLLLIDLQLFAMAWFSLAYIPRVEDTVEIILQIISDAVKKSVV